MINRWQETYSLRRREGEKGFTLIELLIVIIILGVLAAIVVFAVTGITSNGTKEACTSTVKTINTAAESYYAQNNVGAADLGVLHSGGFLHDNYTSGQLTSTGGSGANTWTATFAAGGTGTAGNATGTYKTGSGNGTC